MSAGWVRVALAAVVLAAVLAISVWYKQRDSGRPEADAAAGASSSDTTRKAPLQPNSDPRAAPRDRPERERTSRPGDGRLSPK